MSTPDTEDFMRRFHERFIHRSEPQQAEFLIQTLSAMTDVMNREQLSLLRAMFLKELAECPEFLDLVDGSLALRDIKETDGPLNK
jgi:hypothetical protein